MIFKQWQEIADGKKTQTRRVCKESETIIRSPDNTYQCVFNNGRIKWECCVSYAVQPARAKAGIWWKEQNGIVNCRERISIVPVFDGVDTVDYHNPLRIDTRETLETNGYKPLRIRILSIGYEPLHDITESDAIAEGVNSVAEYRALWESINGAKSWDENPYVWVLTFEVDRSAK